MRISEEAPFFCSTFCYSCGGTTLMSIADLFEVPLSDAYLGVGSCDSSAVLYMVWLTTQKRSSLSTSVQNGCGAIIVAPTPKCVQSIRSQAAACAEFWASKVRELLTSSQMSSNRVCCRVSSTIPCSRLASTPKHLFPPSACCCCCVSSLILKQLKVPRLQLLLKLLHKFKFCFFGRGPTAYC